MNFYKHWEMLGGTPLQIDKQKRTNERGWAGSLAPGYCCDKAGTSKDLKRLLKGQQCGPVDRALGWESGDLSVNLGSATWPSYCPALCLSFPVSI